MGKKHEPSPYTALYWEQVRLAYWQRQGNEEKVIDCDFHIKRWQQAIDNQTADLKSAGLLT